MIMTESQSHQSGSESQNPAPVPPADPTRILRSEEIFAGERVVMIQHAGVRYRLLITRNDRLILQK